MEGKNLVYFRSLGSIERGRSKTPAKILAKVHEITYSAWAFLRDAVVPGYPPINP